MAGRNGKVRSVHGGASLYDFRDLDLMHKIVEEGDDDGWVETEALARSVGLDEDRLRNVGIRLAWMRRYGMLEFDEKRRMWRLSRGGTRVVEAKVRAATTRELEELPEGAMIEVMANVAHRYRHMDHLSATMLRREFMFGTQPR